MGDHHEGGLRRPRAQPPQDRRLGHGVDSRGHVVEDEHVRPADQPAGQGQPLGLAAGDGRPAFSELGVVAVGQAQHEVVDGGDRAGRPQLVQLDLAADPEVVRHRAGQDQGPLGNQADPAGQLEAGDPPQVDAAQADRAGRRVLQPAEQAGERGLAAAGRSGHGDELARTDAQVDRSEHPPAVAPGGQPGGEQGPAWRRGLGVGRVVVSDRGLEDLGDAPGRDPGLAPGREQVDRDRDRQRQGGHPGGEGDQAADGEAAAQRHRPPDGQAGRDRQPGDGRRDGGPGRRDARGGHGVVGEDRAAVVVATGKSRLTAEAAHRGAGREQVLHRVGTGGERLGELLVRRVEAAGEVGVGQRGQRDRHHPDDQQWPVQQREGGQDHHDGHDDPDPDGEALHPQPDQVDVAGDPGGQVTVPVAGHGGAVEGGHPLDQRGPQRVRDAVRGPARPPQAASAAEHEHHGDDRRRDGPGQRAVDRSRGDALVERALNAPGEGEHRRLLDHRGRAAEGELPPPRRQLRPEQSLTRRAVQPSTVLTGSCPRRPTTVRRTGVRHRRPMSGRRDREPVPAWSKTAGSGYLPDKVRYS